MKLLKNKKGLDYALLLMVVVLITLGFAYVQLSKKLDVERDIGAAQIGLMNNQQKADKMLFYLDQSAKYSAYSAALDLGPKGGFSSIADACASIQGYASWNTCDSPGNLCFPDVLDNFDKGMNRELNSYFAVYEIYPHDTPNFIKDNYLFAYNNKKLIGSALKNIETNIAPYAGEAYSAGRYSFRPSFSVDFYYDLNKYFELNEIAVQAVSDCAGKYPDPVQRNQCVLKHFSGARFVGDYALIDIGLPGAYSPYQSNSPEIKFALCIPKALPVPATTAPPKPPQV